MLSARIALFVTSIGMAVWLFGCGVATDDKHDKTTAMPKKDRCSYDPEIERYVGFLRQEHARPVDYILGLFNDNDIVILGERWHPEMTQYELIFELVSDPRFSKKVGSIFTEIGTRSLNADLNDTLSDAGLTDSELERNLLSIYRNIGH